MKSTYDDELPAIDVLKNEHNFLSKLMGSWHTAVLGFRSNRYSPAEGREVWQSLRRQIMEFIGPFRNHTEKEEEFLYPLLVKNAETERDLFAIKKVKEEHARILAGIEFLLQYSYEDINNMTLVELKAIAKDAGKLFDLMTAHFNKEETLLFPKVLNTLRSPEQQQLFNDVYTSII
ncbi:hemerythrin domain-containing protein [Sporosarcina cyprini]|uniref:hemerythrin domain-containing protein n=1 Tax=Sporosarcina cyprini TaxID=2910523 RepID=UPI001EE0CAA8|nr:hemerythrin domain-containing protein [Sporosarcina cyprini]MCG3087131.1 hemerythrin domain-containing protein [Sporosarcina cyprini]